MGGSMTAISLGQSARPGRLGIRAITAIKVGRIPRESGISLVGWAELRVYFEMGNFASRPQDFAGGFVDFLLGGGARHPRCYRLAPGIDSLNARSLAEEPVVRFYAQRHRCPRPGSIE